MTREEASIITELCEQMAAMVAREEQREKDRALEREIRQTLRAADEKRWDQLDFRLDRVQANVEDVRHDLVKVLEQRADDSAGIKAQTDEVVARMDRDAEMVAEKLRIETARIAADLKRSGDESFNLKAQTDEVVARMKSEAEEVAAKLRVDTAGIAEILKKREDKRVVGRFLGSTTKTIVMVIVVVLLMALSFALLEHRDDFSADIATGLASMVAVSALIYNFLRK